MRVFGARSPILTPVVNVRAVETDRDHIYVALRASPAVCPRRSPPFARSGEPRAHGVLNSARRRLYREALGQRGVAQSGSARALGARRRGFKSRLPRPYFTRRFRTFPRGNGYKSRLLGAVSRGMALPSPQSLHAAMPARPSRMASDPPCAHPPDTGGREGRLGCARPAVLFKQGRRAWT